MDHSLLHVSLRSVVLLAEEARARPGKRKNFKEGEEGRRGGQMRGFHPLLEEKGRIREGGRGGRAGRRSQQFIPTFHYKEAGKEGKEGGAHTGGEKGGGEDDTRRVQNHISIFFLDPLFAIDFLIQLKKGERKKEGRKRGLIGKKKKKAETTVPSRILTFTNFTYFNFSLSRACHLAERRGERREEKGKEGEKNMVIPALRRPVEKFRTSPSAARSVLLLARTRGKRRRGEKKKNHKREKGEEGRSGGARRCSLLHLPFCISLSPWSSERNREKGERKRRGRNIGEERG